MPSVNSKQNEKFPSFPLLENYYNLSSYDLFSLMTLRADMKRDRENGKAMLAIEETSASSAPEGDAHTEYVRENTMTFPRFPMLEKYYNLNAYELFGLMTLYADMERDREYNFRNDLMGSAVTNSLPGKVGYGPGQQDWGHIDVRKGAHMFYWLYYTTADVTTDYTERPLVIWLQGGPGASSTGYGNFEELGPLELEGGARNHTWVKDMNVLFIDNPVGTGFSYVDNVRLLTSTNNEIARDLVSFMKGFYAKHPEFETVPLHIFCESYGGKMAPEFALELYNAIQRGELRSNFKSVALGDPWTSPIDSVLAWAPLLHNMGIVDHAGYENIMTAANKTEQLVKEEKWTQATMQWSNTQRVLLTESKGVDFYNILKQTRGDYTGLSYRSASNKELMYRTLVRFDIDENRDKMLEDLMRGPVSSALQIPAKVKWGAQSLLTFNWQMGDFMKPVIHIVSELLDKTDLQVGVFSGHLDLICATAGTVNWIEKMQWSYKAQYEAAPRVGINVKRILEGYEKSAGNFTMFWINRAGHMVPADNPAAMSHILNKFTGFGN